MLKAESGLHPYAVRQGEWPDWSAGLSQLIVPTAALYGVGDGTPASWELVKTRLFDQPTAIRLGAQHLAWCYQRADGDWLQSLICYNSGSPQPEGNWWWRRWASNVASYRAALAWAKEPLGDSTRNEA